MRNRMMNIICSAWALVFAAITANFSVASHDHVLVYAPSETTSEVLKPGIWAEDQSGLFWIYNSLAEENERSFGPYYDINSVNAYPKIFYLDIQQDGFHPIDTLKYSWRGDVITSICMEDETMMWSSCDTLYTKGNAVSRKNYGTDIGNTLYDRALIDELRYRDRDTVRFKNEISGIYTYNGMIGNISFSNRPKMNFYCKVKIKNGKVISHFIHVGSLTKKQYRVLPEEEKKRVKLFKSEHNNDL